MRIAIPRRIAWRRGTTGAWPARQVVTVLRGAVRRGATRDEAVIISARHHSRPHAPKCH
jgi:hypothetical protein